MKTVLLILALSCLIGFHTISNAQVPDTIKIGFLISDNDAPAALHGAELAIRKANLNGGYRGHPFKIIGRSMEGPWGTGSREATDLIFKQKVLAIIGSHDGRNAHIVEQVTTKARLVFLSAWAGDPTLSQAFTPWYFSCVPNDRQQADILYDEISGRRKYKNVAIVAGKDYDPDQAVKNLILRFQSDASAILSQFRYESSTDFKDLADQVVKKNPDCIIFQGSPSHTEKIILFLKGKKQFPMFGNISLLDENELHGMNLNNYESLIIVSPEYWFTRSGSEFSAQFRKTYNYNPGPVAAYAYDAVNMTVEAIIKSGSDIEKVQKAMMDIDYNGITGMIRYDERGNRKPPFKLIEIKNGKPVPYEPSSPASSKVPKDH